MSDTLFPIKKPKKIPRRMTVEDIKMIHSGEYLQSDLARYFGVSQGVISVLNRYCPVLSEADA